MMMMMMMMIIIMTMMMTVVTSAIHLMRRGGAKWEQIGKGIGAVRVFLGCPEDQLHRYDEENRENGIWTAVAIVQRIL